MPTADPLVLSRQRHLKWRAFDKLERLLMILCGLLCFGFSLSVASCLPNLFALPVNATP